MPAAFGFQSGRVCGIRRDVLHVVLSQDAVGSVHVADDDGDVLERQVVTARVGGNRRTGCTDELQQFDAFVSQLEVNHAHMRHWGLRTAGRTPGHCARSR